MNVVNCFAESGSLPSKTYEWGPIGFWSFLVQPNLHNIIVIFRGLHNVFDECYITPFRGHFWRVPRVNKDGN